MQINELSTILKGYFKWNKARVDCLSRLLIAIIKVKTVNLVALSSGFNSAAKPASRYKRIKRFFRQAPFQSTEIAQWVLQLFGLNQPVWLSLDRTNWRWGQQDINILMLSAVYKGIALPLSWRLLSHPGNSSASLRIELIEQFIAKFGKQAIAGLIADREFTGKAWIGWLRAQHIPFCMRLRCDLITTNSRGLEVDLHALFYGLQPGEQRILKTPRKLGKQQVYLSGTQTQDGQLLLLATDQLLIDPIGLYQKRWQIETLFGCLKSKGFCLEETRLTTPDRMDRLLSFISMAFAWAYKVGEWKNTQQPIRCLKHGRKAHSLFRYGLDYMRDICLNFSHHSISRLRRLFSFLHLHRLHP